MELSEILTRLDGVKGSGSQYTARCPAHEDRHSSLSVGQGNKSIVFHCHAGCEVEAIVDAIGINKSDLYPDAGKDTRPSKTSTISTKRYEYKSADGSLAYIKYRYDKADGSKSFSFEQPDGTKSVKGVLREPYNLPALIEQSVICFVEGEKCADALIARGMPATTLDSGSNSKWPDHINDHFKGKTVYILPDNDEPGEKYGQKVAKNLDGVAKKLCILRLPDLKDKGADVCDWFQAGHTIDELARIAGDAEEYSPDQGRTEGSSFFSCFKTLDEFEEQEATWLIPGWIPDGQITTMAADGGIGKTTLWCDILSALSSGTTCILDPPGHKRAPMKVAFLTTEDSIRKKLKKKLRLAGATEKNILAPDFMTDKDGLLRELKFGYPQMEQFIRHFRPAFCVFDPVQGFVPPDINMGSRNAMRDCMAPLITLGEECGTTFLVVCHTNKRKGAYGRDRVADSADLWDISRSVLMAGFTEEQGVRYLSNEKNNYCELQQTLLFTIDGEGQAQRSGTTWKRDREYIQDATMSKAAPKREDCKEFLINVLDDAGGSVPTKELEDSLADCGYSHITIRRAKDELKAGKQIEYFSTGARKDKVWHTRRVVAEFVEMDNDEPTPWDVEQTTIPVKEAEMIK